MNITCEHAHCPYHGCHCLAAENARLREALENERDAWTDTAEARDDDAWMRGFADQRIVAINKALGGTQ